MAVTIVENLGTPGSEIFTFPRRFWLRMKASDLNVGMLWYKHGSRKLQHIFSNSINRYCITWQKTWILLGIQGISYTKSEDVRSTCQFYYLWKQLNFNDIRYWACTNNYLQWPITSSTLCDLCILRLPVLWKASARKTHICNIRERTTDLQFFSTITRVC